jgi:hypothetical protein
LFGRNINSITVTPVGVCNEILQLKIVGLKQIVADLFNVTPVAHKNPLGIKLRFVKELFCYGISPDNQTDNQPTCLGPQLVLFHILLYL